jgi:processive 1,2-diacylglycerol beta-glucosyltransferase
LPQRGFSLRVGVTRTNLRLIGALLSAVLFIDLGVSVRDGASFRVDPLARDVVARWQTPSLHQTAEVLDVLGGEVGVGALVVVSSAWLWRVDRPTVPYVLVYSLGAPVIIQGTKLLVHRVRPNGEPLGFPSGHALAALAVFGLLLIVLLPTIRPRYRRLLIVIGVLLIVSIGASRIYLGVHWATDVLGGYAGGLAYLLIGVTVLDSGRRTRATHMDRTAGADPHALRITVLSCTYGGGHHRVAEVLAQEFRRLPGCVVEEYDYIETFIGHFYNAVTTFLYIGSVRWAPWAWRWFYQATSAIPYDSPMQRFINGLGKRRLTRFLETYKPDLVVCTYCVPAGAISELKLAHLTEIPCATVVTDHAVHSQWVHPGVDLFIVSSEFVREGMVARGIAAQRIRATGIPIDARFTAAGDRRALRQAHGLDADRLTILVMVGAANLLRQPLALEFYRVLADLPHAVQILFVCGRDERLRRAAQALAPAVRNPVHVYGFVNDVYDLMAMSDLMVSKPGGVTTSEALAAELPLVLVSPVPGQEEENVSYLTQLGAAVVAATPAEVHRAVLDLVTHPERLEQMREAAHRVGRAGAAARGAAEILALLPAGRAFAGERR